MVFTQIIVVLILLLCAYYVLAIGKEIIRKTTNETDYSKYGEDAEIDITDDLIDFDVTEINPSDINVEDTIQKPIKEMKQNINNESENLKNETPMQNESNLTPILTWPMDVKAFHDIIKNYNPDGPNPTLDQFVYTLSESDQAA